MPARFEGSPPVVIKERTAKTCLLLPHAGQDVSRLGRIIDTALAMPPQATVTPWLHFCQGLAEYRAGAGHYAAALRHLDLSRHAVSYGDAEVTIAPPRAMCLHRLGRATDARAAYQEACRFFDREVIRVGESNLGEDGFEM